MCYTAFYHNSSSWVGLLYFSESSVWINPGAQPFYSNASAVVSNSFTSMDPSGGHDSTPDYWFSVNTPIAITGFQLSTGISIGVNGTSFVNCIFDGASLNTTTSGVFETVLAGSSSINQNDGFYITNYPHNNSRLIVIIAYGANHTYASGELYLLGNSALVNNGTYTIFSGDEMYQGSNAGLYTLPGATTWYQATNHLDVYQDITGQDTGPWFNFGEFRLNTAYYLNFEDSGDFWNSGTLSFTTDGTQIFGYISFNRPRLNGNLKLYYTSSSDSALPTDASNNGPSLYFLYWTNTTFYGSASIWSGSLNDFPTVSGSVTQLAEGVKACFASQYGYFSVTTGPNLVCPTGYAVQNIGDAGVAAAVPSWAKAYYSQTAPSSSNSTTSGSSSTSSTSSGGSTATTSSTSTSSSGTSTSTSSSKSTSSSTSGSSSTSAKVTSDASNIVVSVLLICFCAIVFVLF
jgi:hypothetical protein